MRILIVDDDPKLRGFVGQGLAEGGATCTAAADADEADHALAEGRYDVILLDVMMPGRSGWQFLEGLRARGDETPVIFLTARHEIDERVQGLALGADDYVLKPFEFKELAARIQAVLRRRKSVPKPSFGPIELDPTHRTVKHGTRLVEVSPREFDLLLALVEAEGAVVTRADLLERVWNVTFDPGTNVVDVAVARLRRRLHPAGPGRVETVVGVGYRLAKGASA